MKLLIINGPNLNMLGIREKHLYGARDYAALCEYVKEQGRRLGVEVELFQSNHEGALVDCIQAAYQRIDGIVINPGAYTHTSVAHFLDDVALKQSFNAFARMEVALGPESHLYAL